MDSTRRFKMLTLDDLLYIAGLFWVFSMLLYGVKKGIDFFFKKEKED